MTVHLLEHRQDCFIISYILSQKCVWKYFLVIDVSCILQMNLLIRIVLNYKKKINKLFALIIILLLF